MNTKMKILHLLKDGWMTQAEICESLEANKATVSVCIKKMVASGLLLTEDTTRPSVPRKLVQYKTDPLMFIQATEETKDPVGQLDHSTACLLGSIRKNKAILEPHIAEDLTRQVEYILAQVQILENVN